MVIWVAPLVLQFKVLLLPVVMLEGLAVKELIEGGAGAGALPFTVTVAVAVTDPAELLTVRV